MSKRHMLQQNRYWWKATIRTRVDKNIIKYYTYVSEIEIEIKKSMNIHQKAYQTTNNHNNSNSNNKIEKCIWNIE